METYSEAEHVNVGSGSDISIIELTELVCDVVGFVGELVKDASKPDGTPRKMMSKDKIDAMGWQPSVDLRNGVAATYSWFLGHQGG